MVQGLLLLQLCAFPECKCCWIFLSMDGKCGIFFQESVKQRISVFIDHSQCSLMQTVILLLTCLSWNIHTIQSGQYLNWDPRYTLLSLKVKDLNILLLSMINFLLALLHTCSLWKSNFKLLSTYIYSKKLDIIWLPYSVIPYICPKTFMLITRNYEIAFISIQLHTVTFKPTLS